MKPTTLKNILAVSILAISSSAAVADPFYINNGTSNGGGGSHVGATTTGLFDEMTYHYWSSTVLTDTSGDGSFSAGDTFVSSGGLLNTNIPVVTSSGGSTSTDQLSGNAVTGFSPQWSFGAAATAPGDNGFQSAWNMSFGFDNLIGSISNTLGFVYDSGNIIMTYYDATNFAGIDVLNLNVLGGSNNGIGQSLDLFGDLSVMNGAAAIDGGLTVDDLFHVSNGDSFTDYLMTGAPLLWSNNQNTSPFFVNGIETTNPADISNIFNGVQGGTGNLSGEHDGSLAFSTVPEPSSIMLLSLALLGMTGVRKFKAS